jgi:FkbM family methyltransferase
MCFNMERYMGRILNKICRQINILNVIGWSSYLIYRLSGSGVEIFVKINGMPVIVRKGTRDLSIAISSLTGEFELLRHLLPADFSGIIIDAGGYIGTSAMALHDLYPQAQVIVVEPSVENLKMLRKNVGCISRVKIVHGALVGGEFKSITLRNRGTECGFTTVENPKDQIDAAVLHETPAFRIRDLIEPDQEIGLLKLDIEGGEVDLMKNDLDGLNKVPIIFAELHDKIIEGCTDMFFSLSADRILIKSDGEKFLSIKR